jgi:hypothetical protein
MKKLWLASSGGLSSDMEICETPTSAKGALANDLALHRVSYRF